jgi:hypothetical protein
MKRITIQVPDEFYAALVEKRSPWAVGLWRKVEQYAEQLTTFYGLVAKPIEEN